MDFYSENREQLKNVYNEAFEYDNKFTSCYWFGGNTGNWKATNETYNKFVLVAQDEQKIIITIN